MNRSKNIPIPTSGKTDAHSDDESDQLLASRNSPPSSTIVSPRSDDESDQITSYSRTSVTRSNTKSFKHEEKHSLDKNDSYIDFEEEDIKYLNGRGIEMVKKAEAWRDLFFDLARKCVDEYNGTNEKYLHRLKIYLGPKTYFCLLHHKGMEQQFLFENLKAKANLDLWNTISQATNIRIERRKKQMSEKSRFDISRNIPDADILSSEEAVEFLNALEIKSWKEKCIQEFESKFITTQFHSQIDEKQSVEKVKIKVDLSLVTQFSKYLDKLYVTFKNDKVIIKFIKNRNLINLQTKIKNKIQEAQLNFTLTATKKDNVLTNTTLELKSIKDNFFEDSVKFINNDIAEGKNSDVRKEWYKDMQSEEFVKLVMKSVEVDGEHHVLKQKFVFDTGYNFEILNGDIKHIPNTIYLKNKDNAIQYELLKDGKAIPKKILPDMIKGKEIPENFTSISEIEFLLPEILRVMIVCGDAVEKGGNTLMHYAFKKFSTIEKTELKKKYVAIIELLFEHGSSPMMLNSKGQTAYVYSGYEQEYKRKLEQLDRPDDPDIELEKDIMQQIFWKILLKFIESIFPYSLTEKQMREELVQYSSAIPQLYTAGWFTKNWNDYHHIKRQHRYDDVKELTDQLFKCIEELDDKPLHDSITSQKKRAVKGEKSTLFKNLEKNVVSPSKTGDLLSFKTYNKDAAAFQKEKRIAAENRLRNSQSENRSLKKRLNFSEKSSNEINQDKKIEEKINELEKNMKEQEKQFEQKFLQQQEQFKKDMDEQQRQFKKMFETLISQGELKNPITNLKPVPVEQNYMSENTELKMPDDGSCLFWSAAIGALGPVLEDEKQYCSIFNILFVSDRRDELLYQEYGEAFKNRIQAFLRSNDVTLISRQVKDDPLYRLINWYFRQKVANYIHSNQIKFSESIPDAMEKYVANLRQETFWGGHIEIQAMFGLLEEKYHIKVENSSIDLVACSGKHLIHIIHTNSQNPKSLDKNHYNLRMPQLTVLNVMTVEQQPRKISSSSSYSMRLMPPPPLAQKDTNNDISTTITISSSSSLTQNN